MGSVAAGAYVLLVGLCFAYFYPIFVGKVIRTRTVVAMWLDGRWI